MKGRTMEIHKKIFPPRRYCPAKLPFQRCRRSGAKKFKGSGTELRSPWQLRQAGENSHRHRCHPAAPVPDLDRMELLVCCGDHGIVEEGVSQSEQEVTAICAENIGKGQSCAGVLAAAAHAKIRAIDVGLHHPGPVPGTEFRRVADGTKNFLKEPAMSGHSSAPRCSWDWTWRRSAEKPA